MQNNCSLPADAQSVPEHPPPASFPPGLHDGHGATWSGTSLRPAGVSCPVSCVPSQLLVPSSLLPGRAQEADTSCERCSATTKTSLCYQHHSQSQSQTQHWTRKEINPIPAQSRTLGNCFLPKLSSSQEFSKQSCC